MSYARLFGLLVVAAAAMLASSVNASATTVTSNGVSYTGLITGSNEGGHVRLHNPASNIECASTFQGTVAHHGEGITAIGAITTFTLTGCTGGWTVTVDPKGVYEVHTDANDPAGTSGNGTLTSNETTITAINDVLGITCRYKTLNTDIGTLTGSKTTGSTATFDISASIPFHSGSIFCGTAAAAWTGNYLITGPDNLDID